MCWHADDLKISHRDEKVINGFCGKIKELYSPKTKVHFGTAHDYLGMDLNFGTEPGVLIISMIKCLQKIIDEFPEILDGIKRVHLDQNCLM